MKNKAQNRVTPSSDAGNEPTLTFLVTLGHSVGVLESYDPRVGSELTVPHI